MKQFICHSAQKGFFAGPVFNISASDHSVRKLSANPVEEAMKLTGAVDTIKKSVKQSSFAGENAEVMETVCLMLDDETFIEQIRQFICSEKCNAEYAVKIKTGEYAKKMEKADSEYLQARASDIEGIGEQLIKVMSGMEESVLSELTALASPEISPAQLTSFDSRYIGGIITDKGSPNSHLSILAGNLEIPYIYGNAEAVAAAADSCYIIIDDDKLITEPDEEQKAEAQARMISIASEKEKIKESGKNDVCKTKIYANIAGPEDIPQMLESGADGVGLFRSEFLFLGKEAAPSEEEQVQAYRSVLEVMGDREVIIRTMDLGSDKRVQWLSIPDEPNPALGLRGVRVSLERKAVFNIQLRALLRAGVFGNLKIMFPMITSEWEIDEILVCLDNAAKELEKESIPFRVPEIGIMIETPAAALIADVLSKKVSFFSIGTNDLTQYTLALDRESQGLDRYFSPHHEAIFRLIESVILEGHKNNVTTGICGQLAADQAAVKRLIAAGVDELSVPISKVRQTRAAAAKAEAENESAAAEGEPDIVRAGAVCEIYSPADGELIPMKEIPDPVFSSGQLGKCIGILPDTNSVYSPCSGTIVSIAETKHALTVRSDEGDEYLIHIGIDTVKLCGKGFSVLVREGDHVNRSQKIMEADLDYIRENGYSAMIILVNL